MTSPARWPSATMQLAASRALSSSGGSRCSERRQALPFAVIAASGWLISCAIVAASSAIVARRKVRASSASASRNARSVASRSAISVLSAAFGERATARCAAGPSLRAPAGRAAAARSRPRVINAKTTNAVKDGRSTGAIWMSYCAGVQKSAAATEDSAKDSKPSPEAPEPCPGDDGRIEWKGRKPAGSDFEQNGP